MVSKWNVTIPKLSGEKPRRAYICLPDDYEKQTEKHYPVMYMFDGHNVFFDEDATYGKSWGMARYMEEHPQRKVLVIDSLSAGPELRLIAEKLQELLAEDRSFEEIREAIAAYQQKTGLLFMLESMKNLANNGRVSPLVAKMAGLLGIRVVGKASDEGTLEPLEKLRGREKALQGLAEQLKKLHFNGKKIHIAHCFNPEAAATLKDLIQKAHPACKTTVYPLGGLCSFYAEKGGLLVGFEKM